MLDIDRISAAMSGFLYLIPDGYFGKFLFIQNLFLETLRRCASKNISSSFYY